MDGAPAEEPEARADRPVLVGLDQAQLQDLAADLGFERYRGRQLAKWIYGKAASGFHEMRDLPRPFIDALAARYVVSELLTAEHKHSSDSVDKLLVHNGDGQVYECVLLPYEDRVSCCLSSQVGCPMGCTFCATGLGGFDRNLTVSEIVGQYLALQRLSARRISHVVFMGMGEPLLNLRNLLLAMKILHEEVGLSYRHMTVSTVGLVPQINQLAAEKLPIHLALSLHSPLDEIRNRLMPVNHKWPVETVVGAMRDYQRATGRKVTFEYLLIDQVNDTREQASAIARLVKGMPCFVNLIPFNWVDTGQGFARPSKERVQAFRKVLESSGVNVTERVERGHDIAAACGQLAGQHTGRFANRRSLSTVPLRS
ncbi:MAG: 23S rRNA (adenine(2503)-C(2))-methyltransferase RlmN [Armatimonadetes bacterium]|nr:23S rRNA (adenine(2503)-C(2))-methyltransferase RlmN [Armatimonadota bacterium]